MAATAAQIAELRRMVAEPTSTTYTDDILKAYIERYPLTDRKGEDPTYLQGGVWYVNTTWDATYDLPAAAADVWTEKASAIAANFDFSADGGNYTRSQAYQQYMTQARYYRSRRSPYVITLRPEPMEHGETVNTDDDE